MTMTPSSEAQASPFQYVPVPNEHVPAVYRLLSQLGSLEAGVPVAAPETGSWQSERIQAAFDAADLVWTEGQLTRIAAGSFTSTEVLTEVLDIIARDPDWYTQNQLAEATGRSLDQYRIVWSKLGPHFERHYGTKVWPLIGFSGTQLTPPRPSSLIHFTTTPAIIERWKRLRDI